VYACVYAQLVVTITGTTSVWNIVVARDGPWHNKLGVAKYVDICQRSKTGKFEIVHRTMVIAAMAILLGNLMVMYCMN
jgi:hypothetical protein